MELISPGAFSIDGRRECGPGTEEVQMQHHQMSQEMRECVDHCLRCHAICLETITHCLAMGGEHASPQHIVLLQDCAQICAASADFMLRGSEFHADTCGVCAAVCERCADECERMGSGDELMKRCAEICRECAESCRRMSRMSTTVSA